MSSRQLGASGDADLTNTGPGSGSSQKNGKYRNFRHSRRAGISNFMKPGDSVKPGNSVVVDAIELPSAKVLPGGIIM